MKGMKGMKDRIREWLLNKLVGDKAIKCIITPRKNGIPMVKSNFIMRIGR